MKEYVLRCAAPQACSDGETPALLAGLFQRAVVKRIGKQLPETGALRELHTGLLSPLCDSAEVTCLSWQPEIGAALARSKRGEHTEAVAHAMFAMHALGMDASWQISLPKPGRYSIDGNFFDLEGETRIESRTGRLSIRTGTTQTREMELVRGTHGWAPSELPSEAWGYAEPTRLAYAGFESVYLQPWKEPDDALNIIDIVINWPPNRYEATEGDGRMSASDIARQTERALEQLAVADPRYLNWVKPLFRGIATTPLLSNGMRQSGSYVDHPGVFNCGFPSYADSLAEAIVHEMSHQFLILLSTTMPLVNDNNGEIYYSSLKGKTRTLDRVLLAYHACANMAMFWLDLIGNSGSSPERDEELSIMLKHTEELAKVLQNSAGLTESGRLLFETQMHCLNQKGWALRAA